MGNKGQAEVLGLLVIVILLIFIGMIVLRLSFYKSNAGFYPEIRNSLEVNGLLRAIVNLKIGNSSFVESVGDCYYENGCDKVKEISINVIKANSRPDEDFRLEISGNDKILIKEGKCKTGLKTSYPFVRDGIFYEASLVLCRKGS